METVYQDMLVECALSKCLRWVRFQRRKGAASSSESAAPALLGSEFRPGTAVLLTNLKPGRALLTGSSIGILHATDNSSLKIVPGNSSKAADQPLHTPAAQPVQDNSNVFGVSLLLPSGPCSHSCLRELYMQPTGAVAGADVSFWFTILSWHTIDHETQSVPAVPAGKSVSPCAAVEYKIFGVDAQRCGVLLTYTVPHALACRIPWLAKHCAVRIDCAVLQQVDAPNDIIQVCRGDRTVITEFTGDGTPSVGLGKTALCAAGSVTKRIFIHPGCSVVTPGSGLHANKKQRLDSEVLPAEVVYSEAIPRSSLHVVTPHPAAGRHFATPSVSRAGLLKSTPATTGSLLLPPQPVPVPLLSSLPSLPSLPSWALEDETRRFAALRECAKYFAPSRQPQDLERCDRVFFASASVEIVFAAPNLSPAGFAASTGGGGIGNGSGSAAMAKVLITDSLTQAAFEAWADAQLLAGHLHHTISTAPAGTAAAAVAEYCIVVSECLRGPLSRCNIASAAYDGALAGVQRESSWKLVWMSPSLTFATNAECTKRQ